MKKLVSIGIALALLTMAVMPGVAAAQYTEPDTFAKVPFAIIQSGFELVENIWPDLSAALGMTDLDWVADVMGEVGGWAGGPLAWTVDMLGWGVSLVGDVIGALDPIISAVAGDLPIDLADLSSVFDTVACSLFTPFGGVVAPPFDPCG